MLGLPNWVWWLVIILAIIVLGGGSCAVGGHSINLR